MNTLSVLVASLMTVGVNNAPDNGWQSYGYYPPTQSSMVQLAAADEPIAPQELDLPYVAEESYAPLKGESYYMVSYAPCQCRHPGFYGMAEATILKPFVGGSCLDTPCFIDTPEEVSQFELPGFNAYAAPRVSLGYQTCDGLGIRARWWRMDLHAAEWVDEEDELNGERYFFSGDLGASLDLQTLDFEVTDVTILNGKWDVMLSGGLRYAKFNWIRTSEGEKGTDNDSEEFTWFQNSNFEGIGATAAVQMRRQCFHNIGLFAGLRGSVLYGYVDGSQDYATTRPFGSFSGAGDTGGIVRSIWEAQMGCEWTRELSQGLYFTSRVAGEVQYWDAMINKADIGFAGMTFAVGLIR